MYPRLNIDLKKLSHNVRHMVQICHHNGISAMGVTKVFCADRKLVGSFVDSGIDYLADSRIENIIAMEDFDVKKVLLRLPMVSQAKQVATHADLSLNSEIKTIKAIGEYAQELGKSHGVIMMVDLGDLREGVLPEDAIETAGKINEIQGVHLAGVGVNLTCYGGVIPGEDNLGKLCRIADEIENELRIKLEIISGGNSSSVYLLGEDRMPKKVNNLRLGEILVLGRETAYGLDMKDMYQDVFTLEAEVVELKTKSTVPSGKIGMDAFGNTPSFEDKGIRRRAILAVGRQDVNPSNLVPKDDRVSIFGASSDHLIIDATDIELEVGDVVSFNLEYGALLGAFTSSYIEKNYIV